VSILLALHMVPSMAADRHPLDIPLREYLLVLLFSILGGFVSWYTRMKRGHSRALSLLTAVGEVCTSSLAGLLTFFGCTLLDTPQLLTVSLVAVAGHLGARAIAAFELAAERRFGRLLPETKPGELPRTTGKP
jgi:hypothetical protein